MKALICQLTEDQFRSINDGRTYNSPGYCRSCGEITDGAEPDAERYTCELCDRKTVYGLETAMVYGFVSIVETPKCGICGEDKQCYDTALCDNCAGNRQDELGI
jgi:hypothetical protein